MTTLLLEEKGRSQVTQHSPDDKASRELRHAREIFLEYFKSIGKPQDTSPQEKVKESFATWFLVYVPPQSSFREQVVYPIASLWEPSLEVSSYLEPAEEEEEEEEEEYEFLHDYVLDDLSVDYHSAKNFHEYLISLRGQHEHGKQPTK